MENVVNGYISRAIVQDPAVLPLSNEVSRRARQTVSREAARG
jgi:hypothetical protein